MSPLFTSCRAEKEKTHFKAGISPSKKVGFICFNENPVQMMKNAFHFILKVLFILKIS